MPGGCQPLASKHTARHSQQHRPPWHPVQLKALLASGRVLLLCSHRRALGHMYVVVCFCLFFFHVVSARLGKFRSGSGSPFGSGSRCLLRFGIFCALMALKPHAESHADSFCCFFQSPLHTLCIFSQDSD